MAKQFFKNFPEMQYKLSNGKIVTIKDFFRKSSISAGAKDAIVDYTYYELEEGDRPDVVAAKLYGNGDLHWVFFLVNDWANYYDWWKDQQTFEKYMSHKYRGKYAVASASTDIVSRTGEPPLVSKFLIGESVTATEATGTVIKVDPSHNRIAIGDVVGDFSSKTITGTSILPGQAAAYRHSFTPTSVIDMVDGVDHYYLGNLKRNTFLNGYLPKTHWEAEFEANEEKRNIKIIKPTMVNRVVSQFEKVMQS
jgi:hypothetical protein